MGTGVEGLDCVEFGWIVILDVRLEMWGVGGGADLSSNDNILASGIQYSAKLLGGGVGGRETKSSSSNPPRCAGCSFHHSTKESFDTSEGEGVNIKIITQCEGKQVHYIDRVAQVTQEPPARNSLCTTLHVTDPNIYRSDTPSLPLWILCYVTQAQGTGHGGSVVIIALTYPLI